MSAAAIEIAAAARRHCIRVGGAVVREPVMASVTSVVSAVRRAVRRAARSRTRGAAASTMVAVAKVLAGLVQREALHAQIELLMSSGAVWRYIFCYEWHMHNIRVEKRDRSI